MANAPKSPFSIVYLLPNFNTIPISMFHSAHKLVIIIAVFINGMLPDGRPDIEKIPNTQEKQYGNL